MIGTKFNIIDLSQITEVDDIQVQDAVAPLTISCAPTAKGPEDTRVVSGNAFRELYGDPSYKRYGQVSIQNQAIIDHKGKILFRRLVADDATLATATVVAKVYKMQGQQKVDANGKPLYMEVNKDPDGDGQQNEAAEWIYTETTDAVSSIDGTTENEAIYEDNAYIAYAVEYAPEGKTFKKIEDAVDAAKDYLHNEVDADGNPTYKETVYIERVDETTGETVTEEKEVGMLVYPLFVVADNGRCESGKGFYLTAESALSKNLSFMFYTLNVVENGDIIDDATFSIIPDQLYNNECVDLDSAAETYLDQVKVKILPENITEFINAVTDATTMETDEVAENDVLFGCTRKGTALGGVYVDTINGVDLKNELGIILGGGTNGSFGIAPAEVAADDIDKMTYEFFTGTGNYEDKYEIFNLDVYQIDACFDANFSDKVKEAIVDLAEYRKDFMFFRDFGKDIHSYDDVKDKAWSLKTSSWVTNYCQNYDIMDPYTLKKVNVTIMYDIAPMIIDHIYKGRHLPFAGLRNGAVIQSIADRRSLNYAPKVLPNVNEKDDMEDIRVNFASYYKEDLILESVYTCQETYTQLSFSNNVMAFQMVIKALRAHFPAIRYQYVTSLDDVKAYQSQVNDFLSAYEGYFSELRCEYVEDKKYLQNKIYRCALYFRFNEFTQGELVDAYLLPSNII